MGAFFSHTAFVSSGTLAFVNSNSVSFSTAYTPGGAAIIPFAGSAVLPDAIRALSAGTTYASTGQIVFSNSGGISFGMSGNTLTAGLENTSVWFNLDHAGFGVTSRVWNTTESVSGRNVFIGREYFYRPLIATRANLHGYLDAESGTRTDPGTVSVFLGLYALSNQSLAVMASSASLSFGWATGTATSASTQYAGVSNNREWSIPLASWSITPGDYMLALLVSGSAVSTDNPIAFRFIGGSWLSTHTAHISLTQPLPYLCDGHYSGIITGLPSLLGASDIEPIALQWEAGIITGNGAPYVELLGTY